MLSCSLQMISEESDARTLCRWVYINDPARSSGMQHTLITEYIAFRGIHTRGLFQMKMSVKCQYQVGKHLFCVFQTKSDNLSGHTEKKLFEGPIEMRPDELQIRKKKVKQ